MFPRIGRATGLVALCVVLCSIVPVRTQTGQGRLTLRIQPLSFSIDAASIALAAFSPDGRHVLNIGAIPGLLDATTGREVVRFEGTGQAARSWAVFGRPVFGAFSADGRLAVTTAVSGTESPNLVKIWDARSGRALQTLAPNGNIIAAALSPDATRLVTGTSTGAELWDVATGRSIRRFALEPTPPLPSTIDQTMRAMRSTREEAEKLEAQRPVGVGAVRFNSTGTQVVLSVTGGTIRIVDVTSGREIRRISGETPVTLVATSPDDRWIITGPAPYRLWDAQSAQPVRTVGPSSAKAIGFSGDSRAIVEMSPGLPLKATRVDTGATMTGAVPPPKYETATAVPTTQVTPDGSRWLTDLSSTNPAMPRATTSAASERPAPLGHVMSSADGRWMATDAPGALGTRIWDLTSGAPVAIVRTARNAIGGSADRTDALSGERLMVMNRQLLTSWDPISGQSMALPRIAGTIAAVSADARLAASLDAARTHVQLVDVGTGQPVGPAIAAPEAQTSIALSANGSIAMGVGVSGTIRVWRTSSADVLSETPATRRNDARRIVLSADGTRVAAVDAAEVAIIDASNGTRVAGIAIPDGAPGATRAGLGAERIDVRLSPTGSHVAILTNDAIALQDVATGRQVARFTFARTLGATSAARADFTSSGRHLIVNAVDGSSSVVDVSTGRAVCSIVQTEDDAWWIVGADGRFDTNRFEGSSLLHWVDEDTRTTLPIEVFTRQYYTPRLLATILAGESARAVPDISTVNRVRPRVTIESIVERPLDPQLIDVSVAVENVRTGGRNSGGADVRLFRNGQLAAFRPGPVTFDATGRAVVRFEGVRLPLGGRTELTFTAYAFNDSRVKSDTASKPLTPISIMAAMQNGAPIGENGPERFGPARAYLLAIGVNDTPRRPDLRLRFAANDARGFAETASEFFKGWAGMFGKLDVMTLISDVASDGRPASDQATKANIQAALKTIANVARPDDLVVISISSHGATDERGEFFIFPSDVQGTSTIPAGAISSTELSDWLRPIDAGEMVVLIDACQSAASIDRAGFRPGPLGDPGLGQLAYDKKMRVLAATQASDAAIEHERLQKGLLSYALVNEGLVQGRGDWRPVDRRIELGEWLAYAVRRVPTLLADAQAGKLRAAIPTRPRSSQTPRLFDFRAPGRDIVLSSPARR